MNKLIVSGQITALASFVIGTTLFSSYLYLGNRSNILMIAFYFVILIAMINAILFLILLVASALCQQQRLKLLKTCGIILLNIPIALGYFYMVLSIELPPKG